MGKTYQVSNSLSVLLESLNAKLNALNDKGYCLYDCDNPEWYIEKVYYDQYTDKLMFVCGEECKK